MDEEYNNWRHVLPTLCDVNSTHQVEWEIDTPGRDLFLRKLIEKLTNPLHHRLISAYYGVNSSSAKEAMEQELANILLEVLDCAD